MGKLCNMIKDDRSHLAWFQQKKLIIHVETVRTTRLVFIDITSMPVVLMSVVFVVPVFLEKFLDIIWLTRPSEGVFFVNFFVHRNFVCWTQGLRLEEFMLVWVELEGRVDSLPVDIHTMFCYSVILDQSDIRGTPNVILLESDDMEVVFSLQNSLNTKV